MTNKLKIKELLRELDESFENEASSSVKKINDFHYEINDPNLKVNYSFKHEYDLSKLNKFINMSNSKLYFEFSWLWKNNMDEIDKTASNWKIAVATAPTVLENFMLDVTPPVIKIAGRYEKMINIYNYTHLFNRLIKKFEPYYKLIIYEKVIYLVREDINTKI